MTFEFNFLNQFNRLLSAELPDDLRTLDQHLDFIIPCINEYSEDIREPEYWTNKRWKEVREGDQFHEAILHIFTQESEYMLSIDGNLINGKWQQLGEYNTLILEMPGRKELFDLKFMNSDFMILCKHGNQLKEGQRKYFFLVEESKTRHPQTGTDLSWRTICESLFNVFRDDSKSFLLWFLAIALILGTLYLLST
jgi:hypothetical protein